MAPSASDIAEVRQEAIASAFAARLPEYQAAFGAFLQQCYSTEVAQLRESLLATGAARFRGPTNEPTTSDASQQCFAYSLRVCAQMLLDFHPSLGTLLFLHPDQLLPLFHAALVAQVTATDCAADEALRVATGISPRLRHKLKVRIEYLPPVHQLRKPTISTIRSNDVKRLIQVAGTVVRTGMIKMQEASREYQCTNSRCMHRFLVRSDPEQGNVMELPRVCPSVSGGGKPCKSTSFELIESSRVVSDHQVIKIQEQVSKLGVGSIPRSILVVLEDDLVDSVKAGDHVVVVGMLIRCWKPCIKDVRCDLETMVKANSIRIKNATSANVLVTEELKREFEQFWQRHAESPMRGRNEIVASICPKVYGLFMVKLAVALTVIGGVSRVDEAGMKTRGEPHMLLIGDPGTGKSQFLRFTAELSPRSVLTTGIGTTSAGLTCTAVKDGGEWMLEAGALVLADRGVCCIDEFSSIRSHDRTSIHEAMEQQTLSVAKAGLVCKLNARTTIFAVTNPKGRYDPNVDVSVNTSIASPLLSRFDLILVLLDRMNPTWDQTVSSFILKQSLEQAEQAQWKDDDEEAKDDAEEEADPMEETDIGSAFNLFRPQLKEKAKTEASQDEKRKKNIWSIPKLQAYICYVKEKYQPELTRSAMLILQRYYQLQRSSDTRSASRTTIRLLESLKRLSQAHARLLCHDQVLVMDAVVAVFVMEVSKATDSCSSLLGGGLESVLHSDFAEDPATEYAVQEKLVLEHLGLTELASVPLHRYSQPAMRFGKDSPSGPTARSQHIPFHASQPRAQHNAPQRQQQTAPTRASPWWSQPSQANSEEKEERTDDEAENLTPVPQPKRPRFNLGRWSQGSESIVNRWNQK